MTCQLVVSYHAGGQWHPATGMDLSNTGCRVRLGQNLERGSALRVRIDQHVPGAPDVRAEVEGVLVWSRLEGLSYQAGIQFTSDDENLHRLLASLNPPAPVTEDPTPTEGEG